MICIFNKELWEHNALSIKNWVFVRTSDLRRCCVLVKHILGVNSDVDVNNTDVVVVLCACINSSIVVLALRNSHICLQEERAVFVFPVHAVFFAVNFFNNKSVSCLVDKFCCVARSKHVGH